MYYDIADTRYWIQAGLLNYPLATGDLQTYAYWERGNPSLPNGFERVLLGTASSGAFQIYWTGGDSYSVYYNGNNVASNQYVPGVTSAALYGEAFHYWDNQCNGYNYSFSNTIPSRSTVTHAILYHCPYEAWWAQEYVMRARLNYDLSCPEFVDGDGPTPPGTR
jgi:hypothetical protein